MPFDPGDLRSGSCSRDSGQHERTATTNRDARALFGAPDELVEGMRIVFGDRVLELSESVEREPALGVLDDLELIVFVAKRKGIDPPGLGADDDGEPPRSLCLDDEEELVLSGRAGHLADDFLRARTEKQDLGDDDDKRLARSLALVVVGADRLMEESGEHDLEAAVGVRVSPVVGSIDDAPAAVPTPAVLGFLDEGVGSTRLAVALVVDVDDLPVIAVEIEHECELGLAGPVLTDDEHALVVAGRNDLHASAPLTSPSWSPAAQAGRESFESLDQLLEIEPRGRGLCDAGSPARRVKDDRAHVDVARVALHPVEVFVARPPRRRDHARGKAMREPQLLRAQAEARPRSRDVVNHCWPREKRAHDEAQADEYGQGGAHELDGVHQLNNPLCRLAVVSAGGGAVMSSFFGSAGGVASCRGATVVFSGPASSSSSRIIVTVPWTSASRSSILSRSSLIASP